MPLPPPGRSSSFSMPAEAASTPNSATVEPFVVPADLEADRDEGEQADQERRRAVRHRRARLSVEIVPFGSQKG